LLATAAGDLGGHGLGSGGVLFQLFTYCEQLALDGNPYTARLPHRAPDFALSFQQSSQFGLGFHEFIYLAFPDRGQESGIAAARCSGRSPAALSAHSDAHARIARLVGR